MKQSKFVAVSLLFAFVLAACGGTSTDTTAAAGGGEFDLGGREVTVGVENAYLPYNYVLAGETEGQGWDYDMWRAICDLINCTPVFVESGWPAVIDQVAQGELDTAADGISITDDRKEIVDYSDAYMTVIQKFIVQIDDDRYADKDALIASDAIIATQSGTTNYELAITLVDESRISAYESFPQAVQALIAGDVDAVIIDDSAGLGYIGANAEVMKTLDGDLQSDPLGFIYPKGSDLIDPVNAAIKTLKANGTFDDIGRKFFGEGFAVTYDDIEG
ncbi:MAG: amino acid ABC transporter substrate-binding protein [Acidimicrobiia bacterium]|nr:amino acid ABC transporter substrate-binding protein [Acidimicrobiia bacterium]